MMDSTNFEQPQGDQLRLYLDLFVGFVALVAVFYFLWQFVGGRPIPLVSNSLQFADDAALVHVRCTSFLTGCANKFVHYDLALHYQQTVLRTDASVTDYTLSPDGSWLAVGLARRDGITIVDMTSKRQTRISDAQVSELAWSEDGRFLLAQGESNRLYSAETWQETPLSNDVVRYDWAAYDAVLFYPAEDGLYRYNVDTDTLDQIVAMDGWPNALDRYRQFPDTIGSMIVMEDGKQRYFVDIAGRQIVAQQDDSFVQPSWSSDGAYFLMGLELFSAETRTITTVPSPSNTTLVQSIWSQRQNQILMSLHACRDLTDGCVQTDGDNTYLRHEQAVIFSYVPDERAPELERIDQGALSETQIEALQLTSGGRYIAYLDGADTIKIANQIDWEPIVIMRDDMEDIASFQLYRK